MNGASVTRRLMVVGSVQHAGMSTRIVLAQTTLIRAVIIGAQGAIVKNITLDYNLTKRALPFSSTLPGEYLIDHVLPCYEIVPGSDFTLQIDLSYQEPHNNDADDSNYILVYGISFDIHNLSPLGRFLPEIISLLCCYEAESTRVSHKFEHQLLFTLYSAGYSAYHGRKYLQADTYFKRLMESLGNALFVQCANDSQKLDTAIVHILASLSITRLIAVVDLDKHEKKYEAVISFYNTLQWFFLTLFTYYGKTTGSTNILQMRAKLFNEHYIRLIESIQLTPAQAHQLISLDTCILPCIYDLLFLIVLDSAESLVSAQLSELLNSYSPNSSTALSMICANHTELINFTHTPTLFETIEKSSTIIYLLELIVRSNMMSLQPELLKMIITPFIIKLTSPLVENQSLNGQILTVVQTVRSRLSCLSATSLFRFFVDLLGIFDPAVLLQIMDSEEGQCLYALIIDILNILGTARLVIDFHVFFPSSQQFNDHKSDDIKVYWDLERYIKSFSYLTEVTVLIIRQLRHTYIYYHTLNRKYNKLINVCKETPDKSNQIEALESLKEKYHLSPRVVETLLSFQENPLSPLQKQLDLAIKLNVLLGNTFGTILLRSQDHGTAPSTEIVSSLNSYLYKCSACTGLVLCNLDEISIRGIPSKEQALYAKGILEKPASDINDITVLPPLLIDFKLSELVESKMLVYKPLSTDIFKHPNLSNAILHILGNFFAGFGFCVSMAASFSVNNQSDIYTTAKQSDKMPVASDIIEFGTNGYGFSIPGSITSPCQQEYCRGQLPRQLSRDVSKVSHSIDSSISTEQESQNVYLSLIKYYYSEKVSEVSFLKPITILLNTLFASGVILGNRIAHKSKEERVYHCSLSISDLGLEKLTSNELYSFAENIWYFVRYYSNSLFQCTTYSDLLFGAYILEFIRFSRSNPLNEILLCQFINYAHLYWSDSLAPLDTIVIKSLESCFPTFILLDLPSTRDFSESCNLTQLSVPKALSWFQTIGFGTSKLYVLSELLYVTVQQILRHTKYQMFPECYGLIGKILHLFDALLERLYEVDSSTIEAYSYTKHYIDILYRIVARVSMYLSTRFIPSSHFYREAAKDAASLLVTTCSLKYYNDTLLLHINEQSKISTTPASDFYLSITFTASILESALLYNFSNDVAKSRIINCQLLKLAMLSWDHLKRISFLNNTNICIFARICAFLTLFELIIFPTCEDTVVLSASFSIFADLYEYTTITLFFLAYNKELVEKYSLLFNEWSNKRLGVNITVHEAKLTKFLGIYTTAIKSAGCARIHLYASIFLKKLISSTYVYNALSHRERRELQAFCSTTELNAHQRSQTSSDFEPWSTSTTALLIELETPINKKPEWPVQLHEDNLSTELLSIPNAKSLSDISIIPLISNGNLQEMHPQYISQTEIPHYTSIADLKSIVATQYAIVFSFTIPFTSTKDINALSEFSISVDTDKTNPDTFMDKIDGLIGGSLNKKVKLLMSHDMPTYSVMTQLGEQVEKRYNVIYSKKLLDLVSNGTYSFSEAETDEGVSMQSTPSSKPPVIKTNELCRRYMSKEERNRRAQYLLQNAINEFAEEAQSTAGCEPLREEDLFSTTEASTKPSDLANEYDEKNLRTSIDSDEQTYRENKIQNKVEETFCTQAAEDHVPVEEYFIAEFSGDDNDYVEFNVDDDTIEGQLPNSIVEALHRS